MESSSSPGQHKSPSDMTIDLPSVRDPDVFRQQLLAWYELNKRDLPWRGDHDPYHVLVSEVMLQQTGVERVRPKYLDFLQRFPTLRALADASLGDVVRAWQGLGYNRRAVNLKRLADVVCRDHDGRMPASIPELERLPGIGRYTSRAIACFAFGAQVAVVDTNIRRILATFAGRTLSERETENLARDLLPEGRAADWNQAMMDYGALVYRATPQRTGKNQEPFTSSNRFWRGRIVDSLRSHHSMSLQ